MADANDRKTQHANMHDDVHGRAIAWTAVAIAVALLISGIAAYFLWKSWRPGNHYDGPNAAFDFKIAGPVLEGTPQRDFNAYMAEKERLLHTWQWIDPQAGTVRMPVEEAMRRMAQGKKGSAGPASPMDTLRPTASARGQR